MVRISSDGTSEFASDLARLVGRGAANLEGVEASVRQTLADVRREGDEAVMRLVERFESRRPAVLFTRTFDGAGALGRLPVELRGALELAAARIARYHEHQRLPDFRESDEGVTLGCA